MAISIADDARPGNAFAALAGGVMLAWGWRRRLIALAAGGFGALALAPVSAFPAMIVSLGFAVWLIDGAAERSHSGGRLATARSAFAAGWWWGLGYFLAGLWWLGAAFLVEPDRFAWALPLGVLALPAGLAVFPGVGFALARLMWSPGPERVLALAVGLGLSEWARGVVLTGFPWNDIGMSLGETLALAQIASIVGLHGLTLIAIAIFAAPATLWRSDEGRWRPLPTLLAALALAGLAGFGALRLAAPTSPTVPHVKLRLIQPNVDQGASFSQLYKDTLLRRYFALSDRATSPEISGVGDVTHLVWPESAFPFILAHDPAALADIAEFLRGGATLITGAARMEGGGGTPARYFNAIQVLDKRGVSGERYDKRHLVPFGEYMPFQGLLDRLRITQFVHIPGGFEPGTGRPALRVPGLPEALPLICYEAIFPAEIGAAFRSEPRPGFMLNLTDDAWFGVTPGPYQHFAQARLRAVETGLPLVRDANTGISAVVDGYGRVLALAPLGAEGVLDSPLPVALAPTWHYRWGSLGAVALALAFLAASLALRRKHKD